MSPLVTDEDPNPTVGKFANVVQSVVIPRKVQTLVGAPISASPLNVVTARTGASSTKDPPSTPIAASVVDSPFTPLGAGALGIKSRLYADVPLPADGTVGDGTRDGLGHETLGRESQDRAARVPPRESSGSSVRTTASVPILEDVDEEDSARFVVPKMGR